MKNFMLIGLVLFTLTACEVTVVEPVVTPVYDYRNNVVGSYVMYEYSETYDDNISYDIFISKSSNSTYHIYMDNFYAADISIKAYVDNNDKITIPYQVVDGFEVEGVGTVTGNKIYFTYSVRDLYNDTPSDFCTTTARRAS